MAARVPQITTLTAPSRAVVTGVCVGCSREKQVATSCIVAEVSLANGVVLPRVRFHLLVEIGTGDRCTGCNVGPGGLHHLGCCLEPCPSCGQQAGVCGFRV
jgi:hypothetical protein